LTAPLDPKRVETFEEVLSKNLTIYSLPNHFYEIKLEYTLSDTLSNEPVIYFPWNSDQVTCSKFFSQPKSDKEVEPKKYEFSVKTPSTPEEAEKMIEFEFYPTKLAQCDKDVFVDTLEHVNKVKRLMINAGVHKSKIARSKTEIGTVYQIWQFERDELSYDLYMGRMFALRQSGLTNLWKSWKHRIDTWNDTVQSARNESTSANPISTRDNIVVVFYVHLSLEAISIAILVFECRKYVLKQVVFFIVWFQRTARNVFFFLLNLVHFLYTVSRLVQKMSL